jgi:hypothetical protein
VRSSSRAEPILNLYEVMPSAAIAWASATNSASDNDSHPPLPYTGTCRRYPPRMVCSGSPAALATMSQTAMSTADNAHTPMPPRMRALLGAHIRCHTASGARASWPTASGANSSLM